MKEFNEDHAVTESSISLTVSKADGSEDQSFLKAVQTDAGSRVKDEDKVDSLSNEAIVKGNELLGAYTVLSDAVHGGMGSVWKVHHGGWNTDLAMKRPQPRFFEQAGSERKAQFIAECERWIGLGLHPHIVSCYYVREIGGVPSVFSEWMENGSLKDRIRDGSLYEGSEKDVQMRILDIAVQAASGLAYSYEKGLVHQDVKPGNILLKNNWDAGIADFGLARAQSHLRSHGQSAYGYTPQYCPAEQAAGAPAQKWMDIYALALTVIEMFAGKRLWENGAEAAGNCMEYFGACRIRMPDAVRELLVSALTAHTADYADILRVFTAVYEETAGKPYPRKDSGAAPDSADSLNNRALSFFDLGRPETAQKLWKQALEKEPGNIYANYNYGLFRWRDGKIEDSELLRRLGELRYTDRQTEDLLARLRAQIKAETGDDSPGEELPGSGHARTDVTALSADDRLLYRVAADGRDPGYMRYLECLDLQTETCLWSVPLRQDCTGMRLCLTEDGRNLFWLLETKQFRENEYSIGIADPESGVTRAETAFISRKLRDFCLHPDGIHCYTGNETGVIKRWNIPEGKEDGLYETERHGIQSLCLSPDGDILYGTDSEWFLYKWDEKTGKLLKKTARFALSANDLCISADGKTLYAAGNRGIAFVQTDSLSVKTMESRNQFFMIRRNKDDTGLLACGQLMQLWDIGKHRCLRTFRYTGDVMHISVTSDLRKIFLCDPLRVINMTLETVPAPWEVSRARDYREETEREAEIAACRGKILAAVEEDHDMPRALYLLNEAERKYDAHLFLDLRRRFAKVCRRRKIISADEIASVPIVSERTGQSAVFRPGIPADEIAVSPLGGEKDHCVTIRDGSLNVLHSLPVSGSRITHCSLCYSASGRYLAAGTNGRVLIYETSSYGLYKEIADIPFDRETKVKTVRQAFSPDEEYLAVCTNSGFLGLWDVQTGRFLREFTGSRVSGVLDIFFSWDGTELVTTDMNDDIKVYETASGRLLKRIVQDPYSRYGIGSSCMSAAENRLYIYDDGLMNLWDTEIWQKDTGRTRNWHHTSVLALSPDGRLLASVSKSGAAVWDVRKWECLYEIELPDTKVQKLAFSDDSCLLAVMCTQRMYLFALKWSLRWESRGLF